MLNQFCCYEPQKFVQMFVEEKTDAEILWRQSIKRNERWQDSFPGSSSHPKTGTFSPLKLKHSSFYLLDIHLKNTLV